MSMLFITGLLLFFAPHLLASILPGVRGELLARFGEKRWKMLFSLLSLAGLVLISIGYGQSAKTELWQSAPWARMAVVALMPAALVLVAAANMPGHIRRLTRHPMSIGVALWAAAHLMANGDLPSLLLFGGFGVYAVLSAIAGEVRGRRLGDGRASLRFDLIALLAGLAAYALIIHFHEALFGVAIV